MKKPAETMRIPKQSFYLVVALTAGCLPLVLMVAFWPEALVSMISGLGVAEAETVSEKINQLFVDVSLLYFVCLAIIVADCMCRMNMKGSLWNALFLNNQNANLGQRYCWCAGVASIVGFLIILDYFLMGRTQEEWLYMEDGPMENFTAFSFAVAGLLLLLTAVAYWFKQPERQQRIKLLVLVFGALVLVVVALEEISWGQRIFQLETPKLLNEVNTQQELNLHNVFTDYFKYAYFAIAICVFSVTWTSFRWWVRGEQRPIRNWLPNETLLILAAQILCFSFHLMFNELVEPIAAMFVILFAWQLCRPYWVTATDAETVQVQRSRSATV